MKWKKLGQLYFFRPTHPKLNSHAANPLAVHLADDIYRVFFSSRDINNKSSVSFVDVDIEKRKIIFENTTPVFQHGAEDAFFSHGVSIGNCYRVGNTQYILFMGWQVRDKDHWRGDIGRLRLENKEKLFLDPQGPFMKSDDSDPVSLSYPWVMEDDGLFKMWYGSTITWDAGNGEMLHVIKYATSTDGGRWEKHGTAIPYELGIAQAFSRPTVLKDGNGYHMWYSYRPGDGTLYRIGYAGSEDGVTWKRYENSGIDVSGQGWDSEMICYPFVLDHKGTIYMLYNGNGFGKTGFGLAVLEQ